MDGGTDAIDGQRGDATPPGDGRVLSRHADVIRAALDPAGFSSRCSRHLSVPNGMDGDEHARFRALVERYLAPGPVAALEPRFRRLAAELVRSLPGDRPVEAVGEIGARFAVRAQSAWLGWPAELETTLLRWVEDNREATRSRQPDRTAAVAERFDRIVRSLIEARRAAGRDADADVTTQLLGEQIDGRPPADEEIVSILRNWTAGDLWSIAACTGIVIHHLATHPERQRRWRTTPPSRRRLEAEIDEVLRIDDPFTFSRRRASRDIEIGGRPVRAGEQVALDWAAANRDPMVMGDPDAFRPTDNAPHNLVYGIGPHACPGRGLATLELRVVTEELLTAAGAIELAPGAPPVREPPPFGGYRAVPVLLATGPDRGRSGGPSEERPRVP